MFVITFLMFEKTFSMLPSIIQSLYYIKMGSSIASLYEFYVYGSYKRSFISHVNEQFLFVLKGAPKNFSAPGNKTLHSAIYAFVE